MMHGQKNIKLKGIRGCKTWYVCFSNSCLCWLRRSKRSDNSVARLWS